MPFIPRKIPEPYKLKFNIAENIESLNSWSLLHLCCVSGNINGVSTLLQMKNIIIDKQTSCGNTPLMLACKVNNLRIVELLIKNGANYNIKNDKQRNIFHAFLSHFGSGLDVKQLSFLIDCSPVRDKEFDEDDKIIVFLCSNYVKKCLKLSASDQLKSVKYLESRRKKGLINNFFRQDHLKNTIANKHLHFIDAYDLALKENVITDIEKNTQGLHTKRLLSILSKQYPNKEYEDMFYQSDINGETPIVCAAKYVRSCDLAFILVKFYYDKDEIQLKHHETLLYLFKLLQLQFRRSQFLKRLHIADEDGPMNLLLKFRRATSYILGDIGVSEEKQKSNQYLNMDYISGVDFYLSTFDLSGEAKKKDSKSTRKDDNVLWCTSCNSYHSQEDESDNSDSYNDNSDNSDSYNDNSDSDTSYTSYASESDSEDDHIRKMDKAETYHYQDYHPVHLLYSLVDGNLTQCHRPPRAFGCLIIDMIQSNKVSKMFTDILSYNNKALCYAVFPEFTKEEEIYSKFAPIKDNLKRIVKALPFPSKYDHNDMESIAYVGFAQASIYTKVYNTLLSDAFSKNDEMIIDPKLFINRTNFEAILTNVAFDYNLMKPNVFKALTKYYNAFVTYHYLPFQDSSQANMILSNLLHRATNNKKSVMLILRNIADKSFLFDHSYMQKIKLFERSMPTKLYWDRANAYLSNIAKFLNDTFISALFQTNNVSNLEAIHDGLEVIFIEALNQCIYAQACINTPARGRVNRKWNPNLVKLMQNLRSIFNTSFNLIELCIKTLSKPFLGFVSHLGKIFYSYVRLSNLFSLIDHSYNDIKYRNPIAFPNNNIELHHFLDSIIVSVNYTGRLKEFLCDSKILHNIGLICEVEDDYYYDIIKRLPDEFRNEILGSKECYTYIENYIDDVTSYYDQEEIQINRILHEGDYELKEFILLAKGQLQDIDPMILASNHFEIKYINEQAFGTGPVREYLGKLLKYIFKPKNQSDESYQRSFLLFDYTPEHNCIHIPGFYNLETSVKDLCNIYNFAGIILAACLCKKIPLPYKLSKSLIMKLLGRSKRSVNIDALNDYGKDTVVELKKLHELSNDELISMSIPMATSVELVNRKAWINDGKYETKVKTLYHDKKNPDKIIQNQADVKKFISRHMSSKLYYGRQRYESSFVKDFIALFLSIKLISFIQNYFVILFHLFQILMLMLLKKL